MKEQHNPALTKGQGPEYVEGPSPEYIEGPTFCINHPNVETGLRCNKCGDPICVRCAVRTPVGYRCSNCIKQQQAVFYTGLPVDYIIAALVSIPGAAVGAYITSFLGFFFAFFISPAAGALVADLAWRAVGRRRSRYLWLTVCVAIVIATIGVASYRGLGLGLLIYLVMAVSAAYSRLRLGLRIE